MNTKLRSRKLSRRRKYLQRKGSLKKKSKMMKGGLDMPGQRAEFTVTFRRMGGICATEAGRVAARRGGNNNCDEDLKITVAFGGSLRDKDSARAIYNVTKGTETLVAWKKWSELEGSDAIESGHRVSGKWLGQHETIYHKYSRYDFGGKSGGGGYLQIINKIYHLKDRINKYLDVTYN